MLAILMVTLSMGAPATPIAGPYLVVWGAEWCPACKAMAPDVAALAAEGWVVYYGDADKDERAKERNIVHLPAICIHTARGTEIVRFIGRRSLAELRDLVKAWEVARRSK